MIRHMRFHLMVALIVFGLAIGARPMQGQTISFFRQFTTPGMDRATAVAADGSGIYVIGNRGGVRKYDSRGNELWTREGANVTLYGPAVADATGVYVLGFGGSGGPFMRKYSAGGNELWTRQLGLGSPFSVAADSTGVYVSGRTSLTGPTYLRKYNSDGVELWTRSGDRQSPEDLNGIGVYERTIRACERRRGFRHSTANCPMAPLWRMAAKALHVNGLRVSRQKLACTELRNDRHSQSDTDHQRA